MIFNQQQFETALQEVKSKLSLEGKFPEISLYTFATLPSTNQKLWELVKEGATELTVVIAEQQTAGKGQWGRQWQSAPGGLYLSVSLAPNLQASESAQLTLCSAWGIAQALRAYGIPVFLKWPNDLILLGRKLGGILTETRVQQGQITKAVVGVGINWINSVPETGISLQSFCQEELSSAVISLESLAAIVIQGLNCGYQSWLDQGIQILLQSYLELLDSLGRQVIVDGNPGIITGVTPTGELRVSLTSKEVAVAGAPEQASLREICLKPGTIGLGYAW